MPTPNHEERLSPTLRHLERLEANRPPQRPGSGAESETETDLVVKSIRQMQQRHDAMRSQLGNIIATFMIEKNRTDLNALGPVGQMLLKMADGWQRAFVEIFPPGVGHPDMSGSNRT